MEIDKLVELGNCRFVCGALYRNDQASIQL
jgi:hypothetical protein